MRPLGFLLFAVGASVAVAEQTGMRMRQIDTFGVDLIDSTDCRPIAVVITTTIAATSTPTTPTEVPNPPTRKRPEDSNNHKNSENEKSREDKFKDKGSKDKRPNERGDRGNQEGRHARELFYSLPSQFDGASRPKAYTRTRPRMMKLNRSFHS